MGRCRRLALNIVPKREMPAPPLYAALLTFLLWFAMPAISAAQSDREESSEPAAVDEPMTEEQQSRSAPEDQGSVAPDLLDATEARVTASVVGLARWVDALFDDPAYTEEEADARLEVRLIATESIEEGLEFRARTRFRVSLPRLSRRASLVFEGDEDNDFDTLGDMAFDDALDDSLDDPSIGIQYFQARRNRLNLSWTGGVRTSGPSVFVGPRVRYRLPVDDRTELRLIQSVRWYTDEGWESRSRAELDRIHTAGLSRQQLIVRWREDRREDQGTLIRFASSFTQPISDVSALRYGFNARYLTEKAADAREVSIGVGLRRRFWKDWIALQVTPFLRWQQRNDYDTDLGLQLSLTFAFESNRISPRPQFVEESFEGL